MSKQSSRKQKEKEKEVVEEVEETTTKEGPTLINKLEVNNKNLN